MKNLLTFLIAVLFVANNIIAQIDYTVSAPYTSPTRNTCGAVNNCSSLSSDDHVYQVTIPSNAAWTFSLCSGSSYDTWLEVGTSVCANDVGSNDDFCGGTGLLSEITATITAGTYYVSVEGYGGDCGNYVLDISGPVPDDIGVITIDAPASNCGLSSAESVTVSVKNFGTNSQSNIPVSYRINGMGVITENIAGPIPGGNTATYTFSSTADLSAAGTYIFDAWTSLSGDVSSSNDSIIDHQVVTDNLIENICIVDFIDTSGAFNYNCNFTSNLCNDGYSYGDVALKTSPQFVINAPIIDSITLYLYYTDCGSSTNFTFYLNGVQIGTYLDNLGECTCFSSTYPLLYTISDSAVLNAAFSDTNTIGIIHDGTSMAVAGYSAAIYAQCPPSTFIEATNDTGICNGDSVLLSVSVIDSGALIPPYSYFWSPSTDLSCNTCQSTFSSADSTIIYTIYVTDSTGTIDSAVVTVTVFSSAPIADAGTDTTICEGDVIQLNASGGALYLWDPATGLTDPTIADPLATPTTTTTYSLTAFNSCGSDVDSITLSVNPLPTAVTGSDTAICPGDSVQLNANGGVSYSWSPGTGLSDSTISNPISNPSVTTVYIVTATSDSGCFNFDTIVVTVDSISQIIATAANDTICLGDTTQLFVSACNSSIFNDNFEDGTYNKWDSLGGAYSRQVTNATAANGTYSFTQSGGNWTILDGVFASFTPSTPDYVGAYIRSSSTFNYDCFFAVGDNNIIANNGIIHFYASDDGYFWLFTGSTGVPYNANQWYHIEFKNIDYFTKSFDFYVDDILITAGLPFSDSSSTFVSQVHLYNFSPGSIAYYDDIYIGDPCSQIDTTLSYTWSPVTGLSNPNIAAPLANPATTTTYIVNASIGSCMSADTITIYVDSVNFINAISGDTICNGDSVQLNATGSGLYFWSPATGLSCTNCQNPVAGPATTTTYYVSSPAGCAPTDSVTVTVNGASSSPAYSFSPDPKQGSGTFDGCGIDNTGDYIDWVEISYVDPTTIHVRIRWFPSSSGSYTTNSGIHLKALHYDGTIWSDIYSNLMTPGDFTVNTFQIDEFDLVFPGGDPVGTHYIRAMLIDRSSSTDEFDVGIICADPSAGTAASGGRHYDNDDVEFDVISSSFSAIVSEDTICIGNTVQLQVWGADSSFLFLWTPGTGLSDSTISNPLASPLVTTTYFVSATESGCTAYDTIVIFVDTVNFIAANPDTSVCIGDSAQLFATGSGSYLWFPSTGLSCTICPSPYASPATTTTYYVTTPSGCAPVDSIIVSVGGGPIIASVVRDSICPGDTTQLFAFTCEPVLFYDGFEDATYNQWTDTGGGYTITPTTSTAAVGNYSLQLTGGNWFGFDGIYTTFNPGIPDYAGFYVRSSSTFNYDALVVIGDDNTQTNGGIMTFVADWSGFFYMNGIANPYNANQWYHIEYKNVDFSNKTFDYYIDNVLIQSNILFNDTSSIYISQIHLFNYQPGSIVWFDDIIIGVPCSGIDTTLSYTWSPSAGLSNPNIPDPVANPTTTTSYIVTAVGAGCAATDTVTIYTTSLNVVANANTSLICSGDTAQLNAMTNIEGTTFSWSPATGLSCTNCPDPFANPASTTTYTVTGTSGSCTGVASVLITVGTGPIAPSCAPITTSYFCCYGIYNVTFNTINNTSADGIEGYQDYSCSNATNVIVDQTYSISIETGTSSSENVRVWIDYNNDGVFDNDSTTELVFYSDNILQNHSGNITIPFSAVINTPLRMRVGSDIWWNTTPAPCVNVLRGQFEDYTVIVLPNTIPPVANFSINILDMCQGIVSFTDQSLYNPSSWFWDFGDGSGLSASQNPFYTYSLQGIYTVTLIVTNPYGSDTLSQQITINSLIADFTVSNDTVNIGENVNFIDNSIGANSWNWDFGDGFSSINQNTFHAWFSVATYTVTLTVSNASGCIAQIMQQIVVLDCGVGPQTGAVIGPVNVNDWATEFYSVTFHLGSTYSWTIIGGTQTSGGQSNFIAIQWGSAGSGQITLVEIDSIGCEGDTVYLSVSIGNTGVNSATFISQGLKIYPNPNTGEFILEIEDLSPPIEGYDCFIYDIFGHVITKFKIVDQKTKIDFSNYTRGMYNLQIILDTKVINKQVILE